MADEHAAHAHGAHAHAVRADADRGRLALALGLILAFMAVEIGAGVVAHSLALLSDAGHMLTDAAAIGFSLLALTPRRAPGARRDDVRVPARRDPLGAGQRRDVADPRGVHRLRGGPPPVHPPVVRGWLILIVALVGVLVNLLATWTLARANRESLNIEGSFQHLLTDLYGFIGTAIAAGVILLSGFQRVDPIVSLLIAALMVRSGAALVRASGRIFLEAAPEGLDPQAIGRALVGAAGVVEVHDLHVWEISSGFPALSAHVLVGADSDCHAARRAMEAMLRERFGLDHTTLQVDHAGEESEILQLEIAPARGGAQRSHQQRDRRDDR